MSAHHATPIVESDHVAGPASARLTLVEYGDYECSYCGMAYPVVQQIQRTLGDDLRFVFHNFPLAQAHPHAQHAAEVAEAAAAQGKFWEMHDMLYEHQDALDDDALLRYATALGLDETRMSRELASGAHEERVRHDFHEGVRSGVNGTPTFFVNGVRYDGNWGDAESFLQDLTRPLEA